MINQFQKTYTQKSASSSHTSENSFSVGARGHSSSVFQGQLGQHSHIFLASPGLGNHLGFVLCSLVTEISDSCFTPSTRQQNSAHSVVSDISGTEATVGLFTSWFGFTA